MSKKSDISRIGQLVLARLLVATENGVTWSALRKDLEPLIGFLWAGSELDRRLRSEVAELEAASLVVWIRKGKTEKGMPTPEGRRRTLEGLGVHQLPPKPDYLRVKIRRRLKGIGAALIKNSVYVLPNDAESLEDFEWLREEIEAEGGRVPRRRGLAVRIITDNEKAEDEGSDIDWLRESGIPVRVDRTQYHMHHKFAVFDGELLLSGSYNWTRGAALYNDENLIVTSDPRLIAAFSKAFEKLWNRLH